MYLCQVHYWCQWYLKRCSLACLSFSCSLAYGLSISLFVRSSVCPSVRPSNTASLTHFLQTPSLTLSLRSSVHSFHQRRLKSSFVSSFILPYFSVNIDLQLSWNENEEIDLFERSQNRHCHWKSALSCLGCKSYSPQTAVNSSDLSPQSSSLLHTCESSTHLPFEQPNSRPLQWAADSFTHWNPSFNFNPAGQEQIRFPAWTLQRWEQPPPFKQGLRVPTKQGRIQQDWWYALVRELRKACVTPC